MRMGLVVSFCHVIFCKLNYLEEVDIWVLSFRRKRCGVTEIRTSNALNPRLPELTNDCFSCILMAPRFPGGSRGCKINRRFWLKEWYIIQFNKVWSRCLACRRIFGKTNRRCVVDLEGKMVVWAVFASASGFISVSLEGRCPEWPSGVSSETLADSWTLNPTGHHWSWLILIPLIPILLWLPWNREISF